MDARLANTWHLTVNERKFIEAALVKGIRIDGRKPDEYRKLFIKFGREDGSSEVQLGQTQVMGFVTSKLVQPYQNRPNEGSLSIFTELSPMADPLFEPGRLNEAAVGLGRIIDRGLRKDSRFLEILGNHDGLLARGKQCDGLISHNYCVLAGKLVWAICIDLHILDNGGNLVDAANIAALAALLTFRRPECSLGGENGQEVIVHTPEEREPLPLIVHHLPIAVTFGFFSNESMMVIDPTHHEEAVMMERMTATLNDNGDICAIQKPGGEGVLPSDIMKCLRLALRKASEMTKKIKYAVEIYNTERALCNIKRHQTSITLNGSASVKEKQNEPSIHKGASELSSNNMESSKLTSVEGSSQSNDGEGESKSSVLGGSTRRDYCAIKFVGNPARWYPYLKGFDSDFLKDSLALRGTSTPKKKQHDPIAERKPNEPKRERPENINPASAAMDESGTGLQKDGEKTLKNAVKPKHKKKRASSTADAN